ncbi:MAG: response regulator [Spirochaetales bacterium]|nr:response regulator [Spirochaetales bacterium]
MEKVETAKQKNIFFSLIIVDDEPAILEGLEKTYDWKSFGFRVVGTALSGEKALVLVKELDPDVIVTDIQMKKMDGLELIGLCQEFNQDLEFVVISAHDDFTFAQKACGLGVFSYLLKPIEDEQLRSVMMELYLHCESWRNRKRQIERYDYFLSERKVELEQLLIKKLLTGAISITEFKKQLYLIGSKLSATERYCAVGMDLNIPTRILKDIDLDAQRLILIRPVAEHLASVFPTRSFELSDGRLIIIVSSLRKNGENDIILQGLLRKIIRKSNVEMNLNLVTAAGKFLKGFTGLIESFRQALASFEYQTSIGMELDDSRSVLFLPSEKTIGYPQDKALYIIRGIRLNDYDSVHNHLKAFDMVTKTTNHYYRCLCFQRLCTGISLYLMDTAGIPIKQIEKLARYMEHIFRLSDFDMVKVLNEIFEDIISFRLKDQFGKTAGLYDSRVNDVLLFIDMYLGDEELSIGDTACHVYLNEAYFGRLFKKVVGMAFNEYLARRRVEKACGLLSSTDLTGMEISERVGISNASYFSAVFKQYTGMRPSEYRKHE